MTTYFAANAKQHGATFYFFYLDFHLKNFTHVSRVKWQSFLIASRLQMQSVKKGIEFFFLSFFSLQLGNQKVSATYTQVWLKRPRRLVLFNLKWKRLEGCKCMVKRNLNHRYIHKILFRKRSYWKISTIYEENRRCSQKLSSFLIYALKAIHRLHWRRSRWYWTCEHAAKFMKSAFSRNENEWRWMSNLSELHLLVQLV